MSGRRPSTDFADVVTARGASLYRTAVLLTHDADRAHVLLGAALARARLRWRRRSASPETEIRGLLVRDFAARRRRPVYGDDDVERPQSPSSRRTRVGFDDAGTVPPAPDHLGDPLAGLSRRGRAWTVLRSLHGQSVAESAAMLGLSERAGRREEARSLAALEVGAMAAVEPLLSAVADSFGTPDTAALLGSVGPQARGYRRRRVVMAGVGATALAALAVTTVSVLSQTEESSEVVRAAEADPDYEAGYGLVDGRPRPYVDGLALEKVEVIDYSLRRKTVSAPEVADDSPLYAVAYCDLPGNSLDVDAIVDAITVVPQLAAGEVIDPEPRQDTTPQDPDAAGPVDLSCVDRSADSATAPVISPLPGDVENFTVSVPSVWSGTGALYLAFYSEAPWSQYPFAPFSDDADPPGSPHAGVVLDATSEPGTAAPLPGLLSGQGARVRSMEVDIDTTLELALRTSEPGQLLVALDGVVVTNDGEELTALGRSRPGPWRQADPALRQGFWRGYAASGFTRYFDSGTLSRLGVDITDDTVVVSVVERGFNGQGWQVVATADGGKDPMALAPGYAESLPEYAHGLRRVATYQVPTDGEPHPVPMSAREAERLTWVGACDIETPREVRALTLFTPQRSGLIPCSGYRNEWAAPLTPLRSSPAPGTAPQDADSEITLTAQRTSERTSLTVGAYETVPYEEFPFETTGQPSTSPLNLRPVPDEGDLVGRGWASDGLSSWAEVGALTDSSLDRSGRGQLTVSTERRSLVSVSTRGRGRFMIRVEGEEQALLDGMFYDPSVLGRVGSPLMYRNGWWTSWTTERTDWAIPLRVDASGPALRLDVTAEGYDPGSLRVSVLQAEKMGPSR